MHLKKFEYLTSFIIALIASILLTGCGGGGGVAISEIDAWWNSVNSTGGVASNNNIETKKNEVQTSFQNYTTTNNYGYSWVSGTNVDLSYNKLNLKGLESAHSAGWSGAGTKIRIVDYFGGANYVNKLVGGKWEWTHGGVVYSIAKAVAPEASIYINQFGTSFFGGTNYSDWQTTDTTTDVVNASLGIGFNRYSSATEALSTAYRFTTEVTSVLSDTNPNAVFVKAAGNSGAVSALTKSYGCEAIYNRNSSHTCTDIKYALDTNLYNDLDRTIFVGSYNSSNSDLESYSVSAGNAANYFIVADGNSILDSGVGTSYAAPRVTGAVSLISQKFPNLNATQKAKLILHTADDLGAIGVDNYYGHGLLNLTSALSPVGKLH